MPYYKWTFRRSGHRKGTNVKYYKEHMGKFYYISHTANRMAIVTTLNEDAVKITKTEYMKEFNKFMKKFNHIK